MAYGYVFDVLISLEKDEECSSVCHADDVGGSLCEFFRLMEFASDGDASCDYRREVVVWRVCHKVDVRLRFACPEEDVVVQVVPFAAEQVLLFYERYEFFPFLEDWDTVFFEHFTLSGDEPIGRNSWASIEHLFDVKVLVSVPPIQTLFRNAKNSGKFGFFSTGKIRDQLV